MWRRNKRSSSLEDGNNLLSISVLGRQHSSILDQGGWSSLPRSGSQRSVARTVAASTTGSARDDQLSEVVSHHEQLISDLSEKVLLLEDQMERLQADMLPAMKLLTCTRLASIQHHDQVLTSNKGTPALQPQEDATNKDQTCTTAVDTAHINGLYMSSAIDSMGPTKTDKQPAAPMSSQHWSGLLQEPGAVDAAVQRVLLGLAAASAGPQLHTGTFLGNERDDCASMRSYCTTLSCGSTQVSGPVLMTDLRPAAKGPSRAPLQHSQQPASLGFGWTPPASVSSAVGVAVSSWPLQQELFEECTAEELQQMLNIVVSHGGPARTSSSDTIEENSSCRSTHTSEIQQEQQSLQAEVQQAISCLALHAERDEEVRQQLCTQELLQRLVSLLQGADMNCAQAAAHLVWYISRSGTLRHHLHQVEELLPSLVALLVVQDAASARAAAFALNNLAHDFACRAAMVDAGAVAGLIDMLSGCDALGQEAAAAALMMLASEESNIRAQIVALNGIQALVAVLRYGGPAAQEAAASALENLSLDSECEGALAAEGAVEALLQVLKDGTTGAMAAAVGALRNLAVNEELEEQLLAAGSVRVLVELAGSSKEDVGVRTAALEGLRNLATSSTQAGDMLIQAGGAPALVDAARSLPAATARSAALGALLVLSCDVNHRRSITAAGAASVLVHAALSGSQTAKEYAARAVANLASTEVNRADLLREGAATVLAFLLKSQLSQMKAVAGSQEGPAGTGAGAIGSIGCCLAAARALQNLAKYRPGCKQLLDAGCTAPLVSALTIPGSVATAAASALCSLCSSRRSLQELADSDGCARLVAAVGKPQHLTPRGQRHALRLLRRLAKGPAGCRAVVEQQIAALGLQLV